MTFCYTHRSVPYPVIIREAFSGSKWEQIQRHIARKFMERESKFEVSIKFLPSEIRKSCRIEGREIVGIRFHEDSRRTMTSDSTNQGTHELTEIG